MENAYIVHGGTPLKGHVNVAGAKNVSLKVIVASLLFKQPLCFTNVPDLKDIKELIHLVEAAGANIEFKDGTMNIDPTELNVHEVDMLHGSKIRVSFMLFAPFLHRFGKARIPNPGGCRIGARPIDRMVNMMNAFGVTSTYNNETGYYDAYVENGIQPADFTFNKKTHTGTELAIMFAAVAQGKSIIRNASLEPEIDQLIDFLNISGAKISRDGEDIIAEGVTDLHYPHDSFYIEPDRNNVVTYACFAYTTKGDITVEGADAKTLKVFLETCDAVGAKYEIEKDTIRFYYDGELQPAHVTTEPEPGFMTDWQAPWAVLMTQSNGVSTIHETVFESRFGYVSELKKLGAQIDFYQPDVDDPDKVYQFDLQDGQTYDTHMHAIRISGPTPLHGGVLNVTDMRAGATLLIASCAAEGESVVVGASEIDRGYDDIENKLRKLGADIKRV